MNDYTITDNEAQTLRSIARQADEVEGYRTAIVREDTLGDGGLSGRAIRLIEASLKLDGMVALAEQAGLLSRIGGHLRREVLEGREPSEDDFDYHGIAVAPA